MSDDSARQLLNDNPWLAGVVTEFKRTPQQNAAIAGGGFDATREEDLIQGTKEYLKSIKALENWSAKGTWKLESAGGRPTTYDKKEAADDKNIDNFQKRLLSNDAELAGILKEVEGEGEDFGDISGIKAIKQPDGRFQLNYTLTEKEDIVYRGVKSTVKKKTPKSYGVLIDPKNRDQVAQAYSWFKNILKAKDPTVTGESGQVAGGAKEDIEGF
jgi:hypothetical protein